MNGFWLAVFFLSIFQLAFFWLSGFWLADALLGLVVGALPPEHHLLLPPAPDFPPRVVHGPPVGEQEANQGDRHGVPAGPGRQVAHALVEARVLGPTEGF